MSYLHWNVDTLYTLFNVFPPAYSATTFGAFFMKHPVYRLVFLAMIYYILQTAKFTVWRATYKSVN